MIGRMIAKNEAPAYSRLCWVAVSVALFADVAHALCEHGVDVVVGKGIEDVFAVALESDQA